MIMIKVPSIKGMRWALFIKQNLRFGLVEQFFLAVFIFCGEFRLINKRDKNDVVNE